MGYNACNDEIRDNITRMKRSAVLSMAAFVGLLSQATASSCDDFNMLRFNPGRLEDCIKEMNFNYDMRLRTLETENHILQTQICILLFDLKDLRPSTYETLKDACPPSKKTQRKK